MKILLLVLKFLLSDLTDLTDSVVVGCNPIEEPRDWYGLAMTTIPGPSSRWSLTPHSRCPMWRRVLLDRDVRTKFNKKPKALLFQCVFVRFQCKTNFLSGNRKGVPKRNVQRKKLVNNYHLAVARWLPGNGQIISCPVRSTIPCRGAYYYTIDICYWIVWMIDDDETREHNSPT